MGPLMTGLRGVGGKGSSVDSAITGAPRGCNLVHGSLPRGRWENEGLPDDVGGVASDSAEDESGGEGASGCEVGEGIELPSDIDTYDTSSCKDVVSEEGAAEGVLAWAAFEASILDSE